MFTELVWRLIKHPLTNLATHVMRFVHGSSVSSGAVSPFNIFFMVTKELFSFHSIPIRVRKESCTHYLVSSWGLVVSYIHQRKTSRQKNHKGKLTTTFHEFPPKATATQYSSAFPQR